MNDFFKLFRRYIEGEQIEVSWNKIEPLPDEVVRCSFNIFHFTHNFSNTLCMFVKQWGIADQVIWGIDRTIELDRVKMCKNAGGYYLLLQVY